MKKILLLILVLLGGCDDENILKDSHYGQSYWKTCIDGKQFIRASNQLSIYLDFDGKPIPCEEKNR